MGEAPAQRGSSGTRCPLVWRPSSARGTAEPPTEVRPGSIRAPGQPRGWRRQGEERRPQASREQAPCHWPLAGRGRRWDVAGAARAGFGRRIGSSCGSPAALRSRDTGPALASAVIHPLPTCPGEAYPSLQCDWLPVPVCYAIFSVSNSLVRNWRV